MKNQHIKIASMVIPVLLLIICLASIGAQNNQAKMPIPREINFTGEYTYDGETWYTYTKDCQMSALDGDIIIKGHVDEEITEGALMDFYSNHIGASVYLNGDMIYMNIVAEMCKYGQGLWPSMCGRKWEHIFCPTITPEDELEFHFVNVHSYGNKEAYKEAISTLCMTPSNTQVLEEYLKPYIRPFQTVGYVFLIVSVMMLGGALSAAVLKSKIADKLFKKGMATIFAGGYILFDIMVVYLTSELLVLRTYGRHLCMMLALYFVCLVMCDTFGFKKKKIADIVMTISGVVNVIIIIIAISEKVLIYDIMFFWILMQLIVCPIFIVLCTHEMIKAKKGRKSEQLMFILLLSAVLLDIAGVGYVHYNQGLCSKVMFLITMIMYVFRGCKHVIIEHNASLKNEQLQKELESSRIAVMLSQIQPHFLYNSLTSLMDLCDSNPKKAKEAIADFADYLRGNIASLKAERPIPFRTELEHIKKYLRLEKLRFNEELVIKYDIQTEDFMLPALSVQPLVENAVKHGVGQKTGGGIVTISTFETDAEYVVSVTDDGVGFLVGEYAKDEGIHIGLDNIRNRLQMMIGARLEINSVKGEGTKAVVLIPKRRD